MSFEFLDSRWIIRMPKFSYLCEYNACPAKQPSGLSCLSCTCKDDLYVCPASSLLTHSLFSHFLCMCVCVCCFHSCFNAPKRPFDFPVDFLCHTCVLHVVSKIVIVFVSCRWCHHWPFIKLGGGLGECELSSIVNSRHDFSKRERLGWRTMDHLCVISMTHAPLWNPLLPFSLFLNANWYMLVDFVFMYGCFSQPVCMLMSILSWIVPVSQWVETPACLSCALWRTPHALLLFFFLHHTLYKCFFEPGFS